MLGIFLTPIAAIALVLAIAVPISLYYAWAASYLWLWFIVPTLAAPPLSTLQIWGACLFLSMLRPRFNAEKANRDDWDSAILALVAGPLVALGLGYAIRFWWM